jgi:tRNA (pseudouridine54-N1)-methyltransferase
MDAVAGVVTTTFLLSNGIWRDTELTLLFLADPTRVLAVRLDGRKLKYLNPDERSTAALVKNSLVKYWARPEAETETSPGIVVALTDLTRELRRFTSFPSPIWLVEDGGAWVPAEGGAVSVVLSDPHEPSPAERALLAELFPRRVSLGPHSLHSSHCIALVHNLLDREGRALSPSPAGEGEPAQGIETPRALDASL